MKKYIAIGAVVATALAGAVMMVSADTTTNTDTSGSSSVDVSIQHALPMVLEVNKAGKVLLRGTIDSVSGNSMTVKSWGGNWIVNVDSSTKVMPESDLSQMKAGDFVGVQGMVDKSSSWTINAVLVRDWNEKKSENEQAKQNRQEVRQAKARTYVGTASNVSATSLTITSAGGTVYTVNISADVKILNQKWLTLSASGISDGDKVRVYGANDNGTISATVIRDVSVK